MRNMNNTSYKSLQRILGTMALICILSSVRAQPIKSYKLDDMYATADEQMQLGDYYNASQWYRDIYSEVKSSDVALSVGYSFYKMRDYKNAERWYSRVLEDDIDNIFIDDRFAYAKVLRALGRDQEAVGELEKFLALSDDDGLRALAENEMTGISGASSLDPNNDITVSFTSEEINSGNGEYSPILYDEETFYFSSFQRRKEIVLDGKETDYHAKIYRSDISEEGFSKPEALSRKINRDDFHISGITFSKDKRTMYFCRQLLQNDQVISSTIYSSRQDGEDWGAAEPVANINTEDGSVSMQPTMGELLGEDVMYFVSNMDGGLGGFDIYYAQVQGEGFGSPVNLGPTINTSEDDLSPFYHDGELYYSTSALPGLGNLDIYKSSWDGNAWSNPSNLGNQYNSRFDDYSISFTTDGTKGFLVSNRPDDKKKKLKSETCCYDIYSFEIRQLKIDLLVGVGEVVDDKEKPLKGATVDLIDLTLEELKSQTQEEEYRFSYPLFSERKYRVITSKEGYISDTVEVTTYGIIDDENIRKKVILEKMPPPEPELPEYTLETVTINEAIRLNNIYYDFEKWDILPDAEIDLNAILELMNEYDDMVIELSSHTDSRGTTPYNQNLSQKRAESAKNWLVNKGVTDNRIKAVGYGESVILNRCTNGTRCTDDEHRFNRRTEFKILEGPQTIQIKREVKKDKAYEGGGSQSKMIIDTVPVISFKQNNIDIGEMSQGDKKTITFEFENTGNATLNIDLVTACKCTEITWPLEPVGPGEFGKIVAIFDSAGMEGSYTKSLDIIANTNPIVVEAKFLVDVIVDNR